MAVDPLAAVAVPLVAAVDSLVADTASDMLPFLRTVMVWRNDLWSQWT